MPSQKCLGPIRPSFHPLTAEPHKEPGAPEPGASGVEPRPSRFARPEADFHFAWFHKQLPPPIRGSLAATGKEAAPVPGLHKAQGQAAAGCLACDRGGAARGAGRGERRAPGEEAGARRARRRAAAKGGLDRRRGPLGSAPPGSAGGQAFDAAFSGSSLRAGHRNGETCYPPGPGRMPRERQRNPRRSFPSVEATPAHAAEAFAPRPWYQPALRK